MALIELAKRPDESEWTEERRERILQRVLARAEEARERRRVRRAFVAGACTVLLAVLALRLIGVGVPALLGSAPELAGKVAGLRAAAE
jgi:ABC-type Fe3+ transport system permease subunit